MWTWTRACEGVYTRELGYNEWSFYYDSHINGTADTLSQFMVTTSQTEKHRFAPESISGAWCHLKRRFPLLAATVSCPTAEGPPQFRVASSRLDTVIPNEITFGEVASAEAAKDLGYEIINGPRVLSDDLLGRLIVISQSGEPTTFHLYLHVAHLITDGATNARLPAALLELMSGDLKYSDFHLEATLAMALPADALVPGLKFSLAKQRWRNAAGRVISAIRESKRKARTQERAHFQLLKLFAGRSDSTETVRSYRNTTSSTFRYGQQDLWYESPALSLFPGLLELSFSADASVGFLETLKEQNVTLGNALVVLGQVALARLLSRRYARSEMSPEEWSFRRTQATYTGGPLNLRAFLDSNWGRNGGVNVGGVYVGYFFLASPFIPIGSGASAVPTLSSLMSKAQFTHRCRELKVQAQRYFKHPLFLEIGAARFPARVTAMKEWAEQWTRDPKKYVDDAEQQMERWNSLSAEGQAQHQGSVFSFAWSTFASRDAPSNFPLGAETPRLQLKESMSRLHCRTGELYLSAGVVRDCFRLVLFYDENVFMEETTREWINEISEAMHFYLGKDNKSKL
ncbi:unnamed protein product [Mycena citricolor]|uniref:Condensation domain-containing protein n=1 Tax=Mycena citricolor TaxID=2018698 RepID=A0AAD2Q1R4_9AGAR|nr:unnamed protein product [Mycena citricolor]